jgi:hypothetical protein
MATENGKEKGSLAAHHPMRKSTRNASHNVPSREVSLPKWEKLKQKSL